VAVKREAVVKSKDNLALIELNAINPDELTPKDALEILYKLKNLAKT
jgi:DNA mismatch repair protein MutS